MIMQITAFKAILARRINIKGCEDYKKIILVVIKDYECVRRRHLNIYTLNK